MIRILARLKRNKSGISSIEYVFIAFGVVLVIVASISNVGTAISERYSTISNSIVNGR